jgi:hypothetical protein
MIVKALKSPANVNVTAHVIHKIEVTGDFSNATISLRGYATEEDALVDGGAHIAWYWTVEISSLLVFSLDKTSIEHLLADHTSSPFHGGRVVAQETNIQTARRKKWAEIKSIRRMAEEGGFVFNEMTFDSDLVSQGRIQVAFQLALVAGESFSVNWTLANDGIVNLSKTDVINLGVSLGAHVMEAHVQSRNLREYIYDESRTVEEVELLKWESIL